MFLLYIIIYNLFYYFLWVCDPFGELEKDKINFSLANEWRCVLDTF